MSSMLGTADFDLSKYANEEKAMDDKLPLKNCSIDSSAFIEIYIKAKVDGGASVPNPNTPLRGGLNTSALGRMQTIVEQESEYDLRDELAKKEKEFSKKVNSIDRELAGLAAIRHKKQEEADRL